MRTMILMGGGFVIGVTCWVVLSPMIGAGCVPIALLLAAGWAVAINLAERGFKHLLRG